jgi:hypothetical protein
MSLALLVTVDTEEEFDWAGVGVSQAWSMKHAAHLGWFQELCESFGVRPTYVIDYPFATTPESIAALRGPHDRGACEIGAHPHPWVNPPIREELTVRNTYLSNLPADLQQEKVAALTDAIRQSFGYTPRTFKAGRYGFDVALAPFLSSLGYTVDTSVMPFCNFTDDGGPDYRTARWQPYWIDGSKDSLLEVPCTSGFNRWPFESYNKFFQRTGRAPLRTFRLRGILDRLGVLKHIVLSPELAGESDCVTLMRRIAAHPPAVLNVTLHSPSVMPGCTPFVRTEEDVARFRRQLTTMFRVATQELRATPMTMSEFRDHFVSRESRETMNMGANSLKSRL